MTTQLVASSATPDFTFMSQHLFTAIMWVDEALSITWLNPQAEQLLAISRGRLLNQSVLSVLAPDELRTKNNSDTDKRGTENENPCSLTLRFQQALQFQQPFIDHDHHINPYLSNNPSLSIDYSVTPVLYDSQPFFIIEMWSKNRQSRITEDQRQQQQYQVARQMLRAVAHEIKNPLAGIRGAAQLLQRQLIKLSEASVDDESTSLLNADSVVEEQWQKIAQKRRAYTDIIISETDRLTQLIGQFLGSNQLPIWQNLNIHEPIEHVLTLILNQYPQIKVRRDYDLSLPELEADRDQLIQVFLNVVNNACQSMIEFAQQLEQTQLALLKASNTSTHSPDTLPIEYHPQLIIQTRVAFQHTIGNQQHKQVLQIVISDNGSGIDPEMIGQIFFPMVTSRASGTGLGLSIVQDIISRHHGMIEVSSANSTDPNYNLTCFSIYLPLSQPILHK